MNHKSFPSCEIQGFFKLKSNSTLNSTLDALQMQTLFALINRKCNEIATCTSLSPGSIRQRQTKIHCFQLLKLTRRL